MAREFSVRYLQGFSTAHRMREDTAETRRALELLDVLHDVVVHETDASDLMRFEDGAEMLRYVQIWIVTRMIDVDQNIS